MEIKDHHLLQPLISTTTTTTTIVIEDHDNLNDIVESNSFIALRFLLIIFISIISIWANYEASKGFEITIINDFKDTSSGHRFHIFFVSNDKISRILLNTSKFAETVLYTDDRQPKKPVSRVTVTLSNQNFTRPVVFNTKHEYILHISSSVMEASNVEKAMVLAVQRGMTRVWLWDGEDSAPDELIDGIVEYVNVVAGFSAFDPLPGYNRLNRFQKICWKYLNYRGMAHFLSYGEMMKNGFIKRLNQAMQHPWQERMVDDALGMPAQQLCESYYSSIIKQFCPTSPSLLSQI